MATYEEDREWADRFLPHQREIAEKAVRVELAPIEEDLRRNTDLVLRSTAPRGKRIEDIRISARVRRHQYARPFRDEFTIRLDRPSGAEAEMPKLRGGYGDFFIYGFESEPGSDRMHPWFIGNSEILREYLNRGGYYKVEGNKDNSSRLAIVHLGDMPPGFVLDEAGMTSRAADRVWEQCRRCWWWRADGGVAVPTQDLGYAPTGAYVREVPKPAAGVGRYCLACGFWWRSGWVMSTTRPVESAA